MQILAYAVVLALMCKGMARAHTRLEHLFATKTDGSVNCVG